MYVRTYVCIYVYYVLIHVYTLPEHEYFSIIARPISNFVIGRIGIATALAANVKITFSQLEKERTNFEEVRDISNSTFFILSFMELTQRYVRVNTRRSRFISKCRYIHALRAGQCKCNSYVRAYTMNYWTVANCDLSLRSKEIEKKKNYLIA